MPYFAAFYDVVDDFVARRAAFRGEHLRRVSESYARGELVLAGALADPADRALLIFHAQDKGVVESFIHNDPYVTNGLVKKWEIRPWNVVSGNEASASPTVPARPSEIARVWTARTTEHKWPLYREHFSKKVLPELRGINGYLGSTLYVRHVGAERDILVETYWRSLDAIHLFAGVDLESAVVDNEAAAVLTDHDHRVRHYEIVLSDCGPAASAPTK
jgi:uncharacterized protein YciI/heme-degrading monooxygenase HmoA